MAILRLYTGEDEKSHFEELKPDYSKFELFTDFGDESAQAVIHGGGVEITVCRFDPKRSNPWHNVPVRVCSFNVSGAVDIEVGDGTVRRLGPGDILIAEDLTGQGHYTREVGPEPRVSIFVPLKK